MINRIAFASLFILALATAACGDGDTTTPDAAPMTEPDAAPTAAVTCDDYCTAVTTNCVDANVQYADKDECVAKCTAAAWEEGKADMTGAGENTLGCRAYHAEAAAMDAATHCPHAALHGGNTCGTDCVNYCAQFLTACGADAANTYTDQADCEAKCANFVATGAYGDADGNTLQCRLYHVGVALTTDPATHCPHAAETPAAACVDAALR